MSILSQKSLSRGGMKEGKEVEGGFSVSPTSSSPLLGEQYQCSTLASNSFSKYSSSSHSSSNFSPNRSFSGYDATTLLHSQTNFNNFNKSNNLSSISLYNNENDQGNINRNMCTNSSYTNVSMKNKMNNNMSTDKKNKDNNEYAKKNGGVLYQKGYEEEKINGMINHQREKIKGKIAKIEGETERKMKVDKVTFGYSNYSDSKSSFSNLNEESYIYGGSQNVHIDKNKGNKNNVNNNLAVSTCHTSTFQTSPPPFSSLSSSSTSSSSSSTSQISPTSPTSLLSPSSPRSDGKGLETSNSDSNVRSGTQSFTHSQHLHSFEKKIGVTYLALLTYFSVSGGPFGMEVAVKAAGPLVTLIAFIVLPLLWSLPEALITAELAPAFPESSGFVAWVDFAFGPFFGFMEGYCAWLSGVTDNALYPVMMLEYLCQFLKTYSNDTANDDDDETSSNLIPEINGSGACIYGGDADDDEGGNNDPKCLSFASRYLVVICITFVLTYLNYRGLDVIGKAAIVASTVSLLPFLILCLFGIFHVQWDRLLYLPYGGVQNVDWNKLVNMVFWNLNYWDNAAAWAGDVKNPGKTYPRSMILAVLLVMITTAFPLLVSIGNVDPNITLKDGSEAQSYCEWTDGYFAQIATDVVGSWLGAAMVFAAFVSCIGMFEAEMSSDSFQMMGMAERGLLPKFLATRSKYGTPLPAILLSATGILALGFLEFTEIIELLNFLYCLGQLVEFAAFLKIRYYHRDLYRPYMIPLNDYGIIVMMIPPYTLLLFVIVNATKTTWLISIPFLLLGAFLYYIFNVNKVTRGWMGSIEHEEIVSSNIMIEAPSTSTVTAATTANGNANLNYHPITSLDEIGMEERENSANNMNNNYSREQQQGQEEGQAVSSLAISNLSNVSIN